MNETAKRDRRDEKEEIRYHVIFYGQVQGVGFRYRAYYAAYQLGLTGWVRNCWDETVEMEVQGDEETITEMIKRIRTSSYHGCKMDEDSAGIGIRFSYPLIRAAFSLFPEFRRE